MTSWHFISLSFFVFTEYPLVICFGYYHCKLQKFICDIVIKFYFYHSINTSSNSDLSLRTYHFIIIDCGLKHELLTVNALTAADYCIIPVQSHFLASEGIPDVLDMVRSVQAKFNPQLKIAGILLTMYQSRPQLCQSVRSGVSEVYGEQFHVFERPIEYSIKVAECPAAGQSILSYAPKNAAAESYRSLAREVLHLG